MVLDLFADTKRSVYSEAQLSVVLCELNSLRKVKIHFCSLTLVTCILRVLLLLLLWSLNDIVYIRLFWNHRTVGAMKLNCTFLVIVLIASIKLPQRVIADSEEGSANTNRQVLPKTNDSVNQTVDTVKNGKESNLVKNGLKERLDSRKGGNEQKKLNGGAQKGEPKENQGLDSESTNEPKKGKLPPAIEKCDSSSNRCTDNDKTLVACLRVPGNESPSLSLLIQNMGRVPLSIKITAPDSVQLENTQIKLQENKDTEVKVSITGVKSGHNIVLSAGHGNCSLSLTNQFISMKMAGDPHDPSYSNTDFKLTLSRGFLFSAALLLLLASIFTGTKLGRKYFWKKDPKYQKLDMELPVSHGSKVESGGNEDWDDSWGDNWDDEETPVTPSMPVTPSLSSKGMASRKFSKEGWKD
ncbi:hypothetical protein STAS_18223 [Striga asiatica]|uniref:DUF7356 domain-containing protein n=1 Tax=Striga asiatica TaxID=4170 RepID=A0A5A7Q9B2_STRAF|nr:hypothetical protein STAS_18223 [Striga asiatica]